ncbi:MAG: Trk family potassium uptake protein, partial [Lachnospiraceae bacterium]|nr:Trk family potassium uptake protein [Lachnospiraceae bacterium]
MKIVESLKHLFHRKKHLTTFQIIIFGFLLVILAGSLMLMLPFATRDGKGASFLDAIFTATSATCVTGLVVQDTATYWSEFGQFI